jgi:hypothetical protein
VRICQGFYLLAFGLGLSSLGVWWPGNILVLVTVLALVAWRVARGSMLPVLPDGAVVCLPYLWAMNAVHCFRPWWEWFIPVFLLVWSGSLAVFLLDWKGRPPWRTPGLGLALLLSFLFLLLYSSVLRLIFPLFEISTYRQILAAGLLFFGGVPVCQLAAVGLVFPVGQPSPGPSAEAR